MTIAPGVRLGPYEIVAAIGAGGMGEVYRARDRSIARWRSRCLPFEREAKAISGLAHPHICTLHDVGSESGVDFLVMEHLEGETLADRLSRGPLQQQGDLVTVDWATRKMTDFAATPFQEASGRFSPDGKWIAYQSDESGRGEIYVQPFPPDGSKWQVTSGSGDAPRWSGDGKRLFFIGPDHALMSVPFTTANGFETGPAQTHVSLGTNDYVVLPDSKTAIVSKRDSATPVPLVIVTNWHP